MSFSDQKIVKRLTQAFRSCRNLGMKRFISHAIYFKQESILIFKELNDRSPFEEKNSLELSLVSHEEINDLVEFYEKTEAFNFDAKGLVRSHLEENCQCFIAKKQNRIIGFLWWADINSPFKSCRPLLRYARYNVGMTAQDALGIDFYIPPEERGKATALEFYAKACKKLYELGYERFYGTVLSDNRAARWTYDVLGLTETKKISAHRILLCKTLFKISDI
jgi:GNAT superfamily N-acetyltransferase